jgi:hypothetical protein
MATNIFQIPTLNPLPFYDPNLVVDAKYNTRSFDDKVGEGCYVIKRQRTDTAVAIQVISDFNTVDLNFYVAYTKLFAVNVPFTAIGIPITGATFKGYEAVIDFSNFANDIYYGEITYLDENNVLQTRRTPLIDVKDEHPDTILFEYWDVANRLGVIFETGIKFNFRIEGFTKNYQPSSSDEDYIDQKYNSISLNSIPYRIFDLYIGAFGIQKFDDWVLQLLNYIFAVKLKSIEGTFYNKSDGAKFEVTRPAGVRDDRGYPKITIIQDENLGIQEYKTGDLPIGDIIVVRKTFKLDNVSSSQSVPGIFTDNVTLCRIDLWNYGFDVFTLIVDDGSIELGRFDIDGTNLTEGLELVKVFDSPKTINITVPNGVNLKMFLVYDKLDAPVLNPAVSSGGYEKKTIYTYYEEAPGDVDIDWNVATGMGQPGTQFEGCAMMGTNGLDDITDMVLLGWDRTNPGTLQTVVGSNQATIIRDNLPAEGLEMFTTQVNNSGGNTPGANDTVARARSANDKLDYEIVKGTIPATLGRTANMGLAVPIDITPLGYIVLKFVKL